MDFDLSLVAFNTFLGTANGRDKLGKLVHYFARGVAGVTADMKEKYEKGTPDRLFYENIHTKSRSLFVRLMEARRTNRWLTGISTYLTLLKPCPWQSSIVDKVLFYVAQFGMLWWQWLDHVRWLQEVKLINGDSKYMKRVSFIGFVFSAAASLLHYLKEYAVVINGKVDDEAKYNEKVNAVKRQVVKHFLTLLSTLHISEIYMTHEAICGFGGSIAAGIDMYEMYPRKMKPKTP